jgi:mitogen-activated protein kinase kinase kinase
MGIIKEYPLLENFKPKLYQIDETFAQCLGKGSFGQVYPGRLIDEKNPFQLPNTIAVKKNFVTNSGYDETELAFWMIKFDHNNLVEMYYLEKQNEDKNQFFNIYMQFCESTLEEAIQNEKVTSELVRHISVGILRGVAYLHSKGILHRDIKPSNILVKKDLVEGDILGSVIKVADYGTTKLSRVVIELTNTANVGSQGYKSPEVRWHIDGKTKYGTPCDT